MKKLILTLTICISLSKISYSQLTATEKAQIKEVFDAYHRHTNQIYEANILIDKQAETINFLSNTIIDQDQYIVKILDRCDNPERRKRIIIAVVVTKVVLFFSGVVVGARIANTINP